MARTSYAETVLALERLAAAVAAPQSQEVSRLREQLELELIEYKATKVLRSTLEEARQEMTVRLHDRLRRLRLSSRRLKTALLEQHEERNPELLLYEGAPVATAKRTTRRVEKSKRPAGSGERCRRCRSRRVKK